MVAQEGEGDGGGDLVAEVAVDVVLPGEEGEEGG